MSTRRKLLFNLFAILFAAMAGVFVHYEVNEITDLFIDIRVAEVKVFARLVRDNWDGIKSVSDQKKEALLQTLDPSQAGADIRVMRLAIIILFYGVVGSIVLDRAVATFKLWKASRPPNPAH
jgi:hypothetical protein